MKGAIGFHSELGKGSTFWVEIPADLGAVAQPASAPELTGSPLADPGRTRKVIYVEDNPSNIAFMRELMDDLPGIELITAPSAEIGTELVRAHLPALVILDINLPGMSGFDAVRLLKAWPETHGIPVIALSAAALPRDTARAREAGFDRYLTKPVRVDELTAVLEELLATIPA
jgi:CheY-like chemotaxis protein